MAQVSSRRLDRFARLVALAAIATALVPVLVAWADEVDDGGGVAGEKKCSTSYVDCTGQNKVTNWSCTSPNQCCTITWMRHKSATQDCIISVSAVCGQGGPGCAEVRWEANP